MQRLGLKGIQAKKFKRTTDSNHDKPVAPDLIEQDFTALVPNQKWVSDLTYVWTDEGWLYLAVIMDLYSRAIIGWSMGKRMTQQLWKPFNPSASRLYIAKGFIWVSLLQAAGLDEAGMKNWHTEFELASPEAIRIFWNRLA